MDRFFSWKKQALKVNLFNDIGENAHGIEDASP